MRIKLVKVLGASIPNVHSKVKLFDMYPAVFLASGFFFSVFVRFAYRFVIFFDAVHFAYRFVV